MIDLTKFITVEIQSNDRPQPKRLKKYLHTCDKCGQERGYFIKTFDKATKNSGLCRSCAAVALPPKSQETRKRISETRKKLGLNGTINLKTMSGRSHSQESKEKMRQRAQSRIPFRGWRHSEEAKKKMSCSRRAISVDQFDDFVTTIDEAQRALFKSQGLHWKCFERANYTCQVCNGIRSKDRELHAHHIDGWNWAIDKRFDEENLVCLCHDCHESFHKTYGKGNNTKSQFEEFKWQKQKVSQLPN